ncbi:hypothetical protein SUGI_0822370 [Cryptomeria japonica]|uniref:uncharacterized protein LOC131059991 isoform X3 n=1 Tax=Cryptomeria japonica TaxID=3369 RepID=UPI002414AFFD|nr:uncharacterized protein LOC131059991 isoform X3 [Cryptomeria japonica]GLJ40137.1 hypothetical protein SUGI_0822370 [Cryptomeria japonica]
MSSHEGKKSSRRMGCDSSGSSFRDLDTEFLTTQAKIWIENVLEKSYDEEETVADLLADGEILYKISKLISKLMENKFGTQIDSPVSEANHFGKQSGKYLPYSYIDAFLKICKKMGLTSVDLFSPPDAVEKRDVRRVCLCIRALSKKACSNDLDVPDFDLVTDFLSMSPEMADVMQKYLKQDMYSMSSRTSNLDPETKKGSAKNNQPFLTCPPEVSLSTEDPDEAESKLKSAVFEVSDSFWGESSVATIGSRSVSPRSPQSAIHGSSSKSSTVGGSSVRDSLSDINAPFTPENDRDQKDSECFRIKDTFLADALNIYLEKSDRLTVNNSSEFNDPPTSLSNEGNFFNEYPTDKFTDKKDPVNGEMKNITPVAVNYDTNPAIVSDIHNNNVNFYNVKELKSEFLAMDYASKGKLNAVDIDHVNMPKEGILHMLNENVPKTGGTHVDCLKVEPLHTINVPSSVFMVNNNSHHLSDTVNGGYTHPNSVQVSDDFVERATDDVEVNFKNVLKELRVDVGPTDAPKLGRLDASHENELKGESVDSYCANFPQALDIYTDKTKVLHAKNVIGCYMHEPQTKYLDIDFIHQVKPGYGNTSQTVIVDMGTANVPNADSMGIDSMPSATESFIATTDSSLIADFINYNAYEECGHSTFMPVSKGTEQGELNNMDVHTKVLHKEEFAGDPTNAPELESLDVGPKYTQKTDSLFHDNRFSPEFVSVNVDQCVKKKNLNIGCGVILKGESVDMVNLSVRVLEIDGVDIACKVEDEEHVATFEKGMESNNVADEYAKLPKSETVVDSAANRKSGDINCAIDTEEDNVVAAGNSFVVYNIENYQNVLKADIVDAERAMSVETGDINCAFATSEDIFVSPVGNGLDTDNVDHASMDMLKSEILVVDNVANKQAEDINFAYVRAEDGTLSAQKGLEAELVNDYKTVLKSEIVDIDDARHMRTGKISCTNVTEEHDVNAANDSLADIDNDCRQSVEVDNAGDMKVKINCLVVTKEECIVDSGDAIKSDNVDGDSINVLKPAIVAVDGPANMQMGKINCAVMIEEISVANARNVNDKSKEVLKLETVDICSVLNMETGESNCVDVTEEDCIVNDDNEFSAGNFDHDSKNVLNSDNVGVDYALNMKTGHVDFLDVTEVKSTVNAENGLEEDVTNHLEKVLKSDTIFDSGVNMRTRGFNHGVVVEEASIINEWNGSEAVNIGYGSDNVMNSELIDIDSAMDVQMVDTGCSVVIAKDHTACAANGVKVLHVVDDTSNMLQLETLSFDSALNIKTGDINCPLATELDSIANPRIKLKADKIDEDGRNVLKLDTDSSTNVKTNDINGEVVANDNNVVDAENVLLANDNANGSINMLKLETVGVNNTVYIKTGYVNCPVMGEVESAAHIGNMLTSEKNNNDSINILKPETVGVDNAAYVKTGDINCPLVTEVESVLHFDNELQTDEVKNDTKNVLNSDNFCVGDPSNAKTWDINSKVVNEDDGVVNDRSEIEPNNLDHDIDKPLEPDIAAVDNAGDLKMGNNIKAVEPNRSEASNMDIVKSDFHKGDHINYDYCPIRKFKPSEIPEENSLIASDSRNQLQSSADCEHGNDYEIQQKETGKRSLEKNESEEKKHIRKSHGKRLWISVFACGLAAGVTMGVIRLLNRKQKEFEIKEGDTLSDISKRAGKSSWKEPNSVEMEYRLFLYVIHFSNPSSLGDSLCTGQILSQIQYYGVVNFYSSVCTNITKKDLVCSR